MTGPTGGGREIPSSLEIVSYFNCTLCMMDRPKGTSPQEWKRLDIGFTPLGIQVWCLRHNCNVMHVDFEGQTHPANLSSGGDDE